MKRYRWSPDCMDVHADGVYVRFEDAEQLRGTLSLAEEGLANYAQDHQQYAEWVSPQLERLGHEMAENEQMRNALQQIAKHRLRGRKTQGALIAEAALDCCSREPQSPVT